GITLGSGNTIRGLTLSNTTGTGILGNNFGTLTVGAAAPNADVVVDNSGTTGTAVSLTNGTPTAVFRSISANGTGGASTTGISLVNTTGSFTVTGDGSTANSGGTISNMKGADQNPAGTGSQGIGLYMHSAQNVSLSWMHLHDFDNYAIQGTN